MMIMIMKNYWLVIFNVENNSLIRTCFSKSKKKSSRDSLTGLRSLLSSSSPFSAFFKLLRFTSSAVRWGEDSQFAFKSTSTSQLNFSSILI